uniref:Uncharacterized protein n=1 Tax=Plectus sambesii TaxID=2011161 RepID=A0A914XDX9_9BILA
MHLRFLLIIGVTIYCTSVVLGGGNCFEPIANIAGSIKKEAQKKTLMNAIATFKVDVIETNLKKLQKSKAITKKQLTSAQKVLKTIKPPPVIVAMIASCSQTERDSLIKFTAEKNQQGIINLFMPKVMAMSQANQTDVMKYFTKATTGC